MIRCVLAAVLFFACFACSKSVEKGDALADDQTVVEVRYATGFKVSRYENAVLVEIVSPYQGSDASLKYLLVPRGEAVPAHDFVSRVVFTPVSSIVCTSTTHIPLLDYLEETDKLIGFPTTDYISSEKMRQRVEEGKIVDLGIDKGLNIEKLAMLKPDMVMAYTMTSDWGQFKKIEEFEIPVVINAEYLERHPLGRAEWIKFMGLFFNKSPHADSVFNAIEKRYMEIKKIAEEARNHPTVLSGIVYGDSWFMPGGDNYAAKLLKDAGCQYVWAEDSTRGFLQLPFETVFQKARNADLWIGVGLMTSLRELEKADHRYAMFTAFQNASVFSSDARKGAKGGSEALELGYLRPDLMLADLVKIAHPQLLPEHELYFHQKLKPE